MKLIKVRPAIQIGLFALTLKVFMSRYVTTHFKPTSIRSVGLHAIFYGKFFMGSLNQLPSHKRVALPSGRN